MDPAIPSKTRKVFGIVLAAVLIAGFLVALFYLLRWLGIFLSKMDPQPAATIMAALVALLGVLIAQLATGVLNRRLEKERAQLSRRADAYEKMVRELLVFFQLSKVQTKNGEAKALEGLKNMMVEFGAHAMVWGSNEVLLAWNNYRYQATDDSLSAEEKLKGLAELVKCMRVDLGHKNREGIHDTDLLRPFINDLEAGKNL